MVGKISADGKAVNFALATPDALPIYIAAGPDGNMWFTELTGNNIGRVTAAGDVKEFEILTKAASDCNRARSVRRRDVVFRRGRQQASRASTWGNITEFPVPKRRPTRSLRDLLSTPKEILWVQQYVDQNNPEPARPDHIIKIGKSILKAARADKLLSRLRRADPQDRDAPHHQGPDKNMWFTELKSDRVGRVDVATAAKKKRVRRSGGGMSLQPCLANFPWLDLQIL